jgi:hypothetical protein
MWKCGLEKQTAVIKQVWEPVKIKISFKSSRGGPINTPN